MSTSSPGSFPSRASVMEVDGDLRGTPESRRRHRRPRGIRGSQKYAMARQVAALLCEVGFRVVTGGLGGIMEATSPRRARIFGMDGNGHCAASGFEPDHANSWADVIIPTGLDHLRNSLVAQADAVVAFGGGAGTLSEMALAWIYRRLIVPSELTAGAASRPTVASTLRRNDAAEAVGIVIARVKQYGRRHSRIRRGCATRPSTPALASPRALDRRSR